MGRNKGGDQGFRLRFVYTEEAITKRIKEGRGQGRLAAYSPWLTAHDVTGVNGFRVPGRTTGRTHQLFSAAEADLVYLLDLSPTVEDIRERFPLLPREELMGIAQERGLQYPRDPGTGVPRVLYTDFLLEVRHGDAVRLEAWAYQPADFLKAPGMLVRLELERVYWERRNVRWRPISDREIPLALRDNARWLHGYLTSEDLGLENGAFLAVAEWITAAVQAYPGHSLADLCLQGDAVFGLPPGTSLGVAINLMGRGCWVVDWTYHIHPTDPVSLQAVRSITADGGGGVQW